MGEVLVTFKVMPSEPGADLSAIENAVKDIKIARINKIEREPVAFGIVALKPSFVVEDAEGGAEEIEGRIKKIPGVGSAEVVDVTRLL